MLNRNLNMTEVLSEYEAAASLQWSVSASRRVIDTINLRVTMSALQIHKVRKVRISRWREFLAKSPNHPFVQH